MKGYSKGLNQEKNLFKPVYCLSCQQRKVCGKISWEYCCPCCYQKAREKTEGYSDYQQFYQQKEWEKKEQVHQLQLLSNYQGCQDCGSSAVDAYALFEENRLVCWACLTKKEGRSSNPISFWEQSKWYKKYWKIELLDWLEQGLLPVNGDCAKKWLKDSEHLKNCACLEQESREVYDLLVSSLQEIQEKLKECQCEKSEKVRVDSDCFAWCERCEATIRVASKKRVVKNRNDPKFWGLEILEKILCLGCLSNYRELMPISKQYNLNKYLKRYEDGKTKS